jgi:hypothetical protein
VELGEDVRLDIELFPLSYSYRYNFAGRRHTNFLVRSGCTVFFSRQFALTCLQGFSDANRTDPVIASMMEEPDGKTARILWRNKEVDCWIFCGAYLTPVLFLYRAATSTYIPSRMA